MLMAINSRKPSDNYLRSHSKTELFPNPSNVSAVTRSFKYLNL